MESATFACPCSDTQANKVESFPGRGDSMIKPERMIIRDCYRPMTDLFLNKFSVVNKRVYVTGTPGTGKSIYRNYVAWHLFNKDKAAICVAMHKGGYDFVDLLCRDASGNVRAAKVSPVHMVTGLFPDFTLGQNFFCLSDVSKGDDRFCDVFDGGSVIFTSPNPKCWQQGAKQGGSFIFMPLWTQDELLRGDNSDVFQDRFIKYGGVVRLVWGTNALVQTHEGRLSGDVSNISTLNTLIDRHSFDAVPHHFVYISPHRLEDGSLQYDSSTDVTLEFGSRYLARKMATYYATSLLSRSANKFGVNNAVVYGLFFESVCLILLLSEYSNSCAFHIRRLTHKGQSHLFPQGGEQFSSLPSKEPFEFNDEKDFLTRLDGHPDALGWPRSTVFAGFDAVLAKTINNKNIAFLFQVTIADQHPLSRRGFQILKEVAAKYVPVVIYVVPCNSRQHYNAQKLYAGAPQDETDFFDKCHQYCMSIDVRKPIKRSASPAGGFDGKKAKLRKNISSRNFGCHPDDSIT